MDRAVESVWKSIPTIEGAGVHLKRVFGHAQIPRLDPFLLLDDFSSTHAPDYLPGFPWHPHRGIETVTYILEGKVAHEDSLGNKGLIKSEEVQWMTAGSGVIHQEMPQKSTALSGFQLWVNLPRARKMTDPRYQEVSKGEIPEVEYQGSKVKVICGTVSGVKGPVQDLFVKPEYLDVTIPAGSELAHPIPQGFKVFSYVVSGEGQIGGQETKGGELVLFKDGDQVRMHAGKHDLRLLLISGKPLGEPIAWYGPVVMNTQDELKTAFAEYEEGTFLKTTPEL